LGSIEAIQNKKTTENHNEVKKNMRCPICQGYNIQILQSGINMKQQTVRNINPLQPFTSYKHRQRKKLSAVKVGAAVMTMGMSTIVTGGIRKKAQFEVFCTACGHRWKTK
jgi:hypothetical protein